MVYGGYVLRFGGKIERKKGEERIDGPFEWTKRHGQMKRYQEVMLLFLCLVLLSMVSTLYSPHVDNEERHILFPMSVHEDHHLLIKGILLSCYRAGQP